MWINGAITTPAYDAAMSDEMRLEQVSGRTYRLRGLRASAQGAAPLRLRPASERHEGDVPTSKFAFLNRSAGDGGEKPPRPRRSFVRRDAGQ
jgi:hypothetical protein